MLIHLSAPSTAQLSVDKPLLHSGPATVISQVIGKLVSAPGSWQFHCNQQPAASGPFNMMDSVAEEENCNLFYLLKICNDTWNRCKVVNCDSHNTKDKKTLYSIARVCGRLVDVSICPLLPIIYSNSSVATLRCAALPLLLCSPSWPSRILPILCILCILMLVSVDICW